MNTLSKKAFFGQTFIKIRMLRTTKRIQTLEVTIEVKSEFMCIEIMGPLKYFLQYETIHFRNIYPLKRLKQLELWLISVVIVDICLK